MAGSCSNSGELFEEPILRIFGVNSELNLTKAQWKPRPGPATEETLAQQAKGNITYGTI